MTSLKATDVALEGFRVTRENPRTFLLWCGFSLFVSIIGAAITIALGDEARQAIEVIGDRQAPDLGVLLKAFEELSPLLIMGLVVQCVTVAAVFRIVLRHADHGFGYLKFGADELRLIALTLIYIVLVMLVVTAITFLAGVVALIASVGGPQFAVLAGLGAEIFFLGLLLFIAVRLSLAPAITFAEKRIAIFDSWKLTHGMAWRLGFAYALSLIYMFIIALLTLSIFSALVAVFNGGDIAASGRAMNPDQSSFAAYFTPLTIISLLVSAPLSALWYAVIAAPAAIAYRELHGPVADEGTQGA